MGVEAPDGMVSCSLDDGESVEGEGITEDGGPFGALEASMASMGSAGSARSAGSMG